MSLRDKFTGPNSTIAYLITSAIGVVLFMTIAGALVYDNTRGLIDAQGHVAHTHEVLTALEHAQLLAERVDYSTRLVALTGDQKDMSSARGGVYQFRAAATHVSELVGDNPNQKNNAQDIVNCAQGLLRLLDGLQKGSEPPTTQLQRCEQSINQMQEQEQRLLRERDQNSQHTTDTSFMTQAAYAGFALVVLVVLFGMLLRDAMLRRKISHKITSTNLELGRSVQSLEGQAREAELLKTCRDELQLCVDVAQVYETAATGFSRLLEGTSGCLGMINSSRNLVEVVSRWGDTAVEECWPPDACCGLRSGYPRWRAPKMSDIHCAHFLGDRPERYLCLPIVAHGNALGVVFVACESDAMMQLVQQRMDGLRQFVQLTGMTLATLNLRTKLENQSIRDSLTGLFNRQAMQIALERELSRSSRRGDTLAVMMLDVDHFKRFNDANGHAAGDAVLKAIADVFREHIRAEDVACRYGGEEFTLILPDVTPVAAYERAEAVRRAIENLRVPLDRGVYGEVTISIGVALSPNDGRTTEQLLRRADQALYRAKREGRNQVSLAELVTV